MPHVEFINPAQAEDNIATLKIDDQIYSLEQVMANTSLASHAVGDFYPATPFNSTSLQVNLTKTPSLLAKEIFADDQLKEIIYTDNNKFIVLKGSFATDTILNITFISPFGVILSNATFTNFEIVNILSPSGVVYIYNSTASNFVINSHCVLLSGELTTLSLAINAINLVQKGSISANTLTVTFNEDSDRVIILGKILTQNNISFFLAQSTIHIDSQASIESTQGFIKIYDVAEFINNIFLKGKAGIEIRAAERVKNNKIIATHGLLSITAKFFESSGDIEADVLHIEITSPVSGGSGVEISGEIKTQHDATIILGGSKIVLVVGSTMSIEGFLMIKGAYELTNNIYLWAKQGIYISDFGGEGVGVVNNKEIITPGTFEVWSKSFDNYNYVEVVNIAKFVLTHSFSNQASGMIKLGGLLVQNPWHPISQFTNLGIIKIDTLGATIDAVSANFLDIAGRVEKKQVDGAQYITDPVFVEGVRQHCYPSTRNFWVAYPGHHHQTYYQNLSPVNDLGNHILKLLMYPYGLVKFYEYYFSTHPVGSFFESNSDITFNVGTLTQGYSKIYSFGKIIFHHTAIIQNQIVLHREEELLFEKHRTNGCSFQIIYRTYNPIMHGVGGFFGTSTGLRFSSSGSNVPQLEYNAATIDFTQGTRSTLTQGTSTTSNAVALYQPSAATEFVSLQGLYIVRSSSGGVADVIFEGKSLLGGFFPSAFVWESVLRQMSYGHFKPNHDDFGALVVWGHPTVDNSQSAYALVPVGADSSTRMLGDPLLYEHIFNEAIFKLFSSIRGINNNDLFALLSQECSKISARFGIAYGEAPTISQVNAAYNPMACPIKTTQCYDLAPECYDYKIFYSDKCLRHFASDAGASLLTEGGIDVEINGNMLIGYMAKIEAGQEITLNINGDVLVLGGIKGGGIKLDVTGNLVSTGTLESTADLEIDAKNIAIAGEVSAKNNLAINAVHRLILASLKSISETGGYGDYRFNSQIITETKVKADGELSLKSGDDLTIIGVHVIGKEVQITSQNGRVDIVPLALYKKAVTSARRYYYEHRSLKFYQSVIEALEPNQADFKNGVVRLGNDVAKHRGAKGIVIEAESGILLDSVNAYTDGKFKLLSPNGEVKLATSSEYNSVVWSYTKDRGGLAGAFGGTKTHYKREESSTPLISRIVAAVIEFVTPKNIEIGIDIITYAVEFNRDGATKDSMISIIPKMATYYIETKTAKKGLLFEFSDSGNFIFAGSKTKGEGRAEVQVIPTVIQLGGITDDPNNPPRFLLYSKGGFQMVNGRVEEYRDQSGNLVEGRKSVIIIQTDDIVLESVPDSKFNFAVLDEKGVGIGFNANSGEVALKAGLFGYKEQSATVETKHNNPPSLVSEYLLLNATNSLKDVQAVYDNEQMDINAKIIFHGVAKDSVTQTDLTRIMEIGAKIGFKFGSLGRMVDAASRAAQQDFNTPEGIINGGFAAFQGYHEALKLMTGSGGMGAGAWAFAHYSEEKSTSTITKEIPTVIRAGSLKIETESWELVGTQVAAYRAYIKAKNVKTRPAQMSRDSSSSSNSFDVEIPLSSGAPLGLSGSIGGSKGQERIMMNARIHIHEDLRLEVTGHADMKGVSLSAKSLEAFFNSLLLESVQDISKHSSWGVSLGLSSKDISSIGGQISNSERHAVRELTSILGSNKCNIVVANALRLNGAMIANAHRADDGTYSDHGALTLSVGELFVQHIYDYDHGYTLGATISNSAFMPTIGGRDGEGETLSTLGGGKVKCTTEGGTCETDQANRDVVNPQTWTQHYDIDPITAYIPIGGLPNLPRTPDNKVEWDKVNENLEKQVNTVFKDLINIFADNKVEEIPLPKTDNCQDDGDETRDVKDEDPTKKAKEEFIKAFREGLEKQFGKEEAARLARIGMHRASELIGSLESLDPKNYVVDGDKIIIALPKKGVIKAGAGQAMEVAFDIVTAEAAKQAGKGVVKVGKYFVRVNPYVLATLTAYEIGSYVYENREDIALKLGEVTEFAKKMVDNARDTSRQKTKQDLAGNYGSPNPDPDDWEPDDEEKERKTNPEKSESKIWKELKPYRKDIKTNDLSGKKQRFYQWDKLHNEIEMYDSRGNPIDAIDPKTGARLLKDVSKHKPLKL